MHFVGKILVILVLILSIMFMAFAGVVYNAQISWRAEAQKQKGLLDKEAGKHKDDLADYERFKTEMNVKLTAAVQQAAQVEAANKGLLADIDRLKKEIGDLSVARKTATEQSLIANEEAAARNEESVNLRGLNHEQAIARDAEFNLRLKLEDQLHSLQLDLDAARLKNKVLLSDISTLRQALEGAGLSSDVKELAGRNSPPPPVEGIIQEVKTPKRQGASELVEISLGSDQGLKKGHEMTVYRSGLNKGAHGKYLAKIVIVNTYPDKAVGQVIEGSRNGVIQKGDNVTTKL
jgi:chromosome segregation ATPase